MLPSTVRRIATVHAHPQSPLLSSFAPAAAFALSSNPRCAQRRRYSSSSKPSSPNDSPKNIPAGQVAASPAQSSKGEKRKRKAKDSKPAQQKLPSVPSTQDVPREALAMATFFSLHRPISVTHSFPKAITDEAFAKIFAPRSKPTPYNKVVSTLSRAVDQLEQPMQGLSIATQHATDTAVAAPNEANGESVQQISVRHADGTESSVYVQLDQMSGQFLPFHPPPIPLPHPTRGAEMAPSEEEAAMQQQQQEPQTRIFKAMFTLEETIDEAGNTHILAHTPQLVEENHGDGEAATESNYQPRSFLERMALRAFRRAQARGGQTGAGSAGMYYAISVKRQRKLKMKKKKYKKLMRRTRNERRKLDRV